MNFCFSSSSQFSLIYLFILPIYLNQIVRKFLKCYIVISLKHLCQHNLNLVTLDIEISKKRVDKYWVCRICSENLTFLQKPLAFDLTVDCIRHMGHIVSQKYQFWVWELSSLVQSVVDRRVCLRHRDHWGSYCHFFYHFLFLTNCYNGKLIKTFLQVFFYCLDKLSPNSRP